MTGAYVFYSCCCRRKPNTWNESHLELNRAKKPWFLSRMSYRKLGRREPFWRAQINQELSESVDPDIFINEANSSSSTQSPIRAPEWFIKQLKERKKDYELKPGEIAVRFINTPTGEDIIVTARPTENVMDVADSVGIKIPRYCETGVCGTCTAELEDLSSVDGRVAFRPCCTDVYLPTGCDEMVVDVFHCRNQSTAVNYAEEFPQSERMLTRECSTCLGQGTVACFACNGTGILLDNDSEELCAYCMGRKIALCADCQGKGLIKLEW